MQFKVFFPTIIVLNDKKKFQCLCVVCVCYLVAAKQSKNKYNQHNLPPASRRTRERLSGFLSGNLLPASSVTPRERVMGVFVFCFCFFFFGFAFLCANLSILIDLSNQSIRVVLFLSFLCIVFAIAFDWLQNTLF